MTKYDEHGKRVYELPGKIVPIVHDCQAEIKQRLAEARPTGCPLNGTYTRPGDLADPTDRLESIVSGLGGYPRRNEIMHGCVALRDPICYLERASKRSHRRVYHPQVTCKEQCPVYQLVARTMEQVYTAPNEETSR